MKRNSQENINLCDKYEKDLIELIYNKSNGEIPEIFCKRLAKRIIRRKMFDDLMGKNKNIEEYVEDYIWAYFQ